MTTRHHNQTTWSKPWQLEAGIVHECWGLLPVIAQIHFYVCVCVCVCVGQRCKIKGVGVGGG